MEHDEEGSSEYGSGSEYTESGEEGDEEEVDEEEVDEEEEPKLKYMRLGSNVTETLRRDAASCMAVHERFLALGTHWGVVYVLDFAGNEIKRYSIHKATVNELSIDDCGEYVASCCNDGKVVISSLYGNDQVVHTHKRPILTVALDPEYHRKQTRRFVCGGRAGQLILCSKAWLLGTKNTVLHQGEGTIYCAKWRGSLVAWAYDKGVRIYDVESEQFISFIDRPKKSPRPDLYRCNLCWETDTMLLIGWADSIKIAQIKEKSLSTAGLASKCAEIVALFQTDFWICGLAPFGEYLVVLAYVDEADSDEDDGSTPSAPQSEPPELRIITRFNQEVSSDALTIHGFERYQATDYRLDHMTGESMFYVVSPKDIVVAKPRDLDDHISWLLHNERYPEALEAARGNERHIRSHKLIDIGEAYLTHLVNDVCDYNQAAALCPRILGKDPELWEKWIFRFAKIRQLGAISSYIPVGNPLLSQTVYEMVLNYFLINNHERLYRTVQEWPSNIYNIQSIVTAVLEKIETTSDEDTLMDTLAQLYTLQKKYDKTLSIYLQLKRGNVFELIEKHDLYDSIQNKVALLINYKQDEAVQLLVNNVGRIPVATVLNQLKEQPYWQHVYLDRLFQKDARAAPEFHELQVKLYADYAAKSLMTFLKQSIYYSFETALEVCRERKLYREMVYILGRMGSNEQALRLIIDELGDVKQAIEFCQTQNDDDLWDELIEHSMRSPAHVSDLLEHIGGAQVDPIRIIREIPAQMYISSLRNRLIKIISDYNLQMSLREGCNAVLKADCVDLMEKLNRSQRAGIKVDNTKRCATCGNPVIPGKGTTGCVIFFCSHIYHQRCLKMGIEAIRQAMEKAQSAGGGDGQPMMPVQEAPGNQLWCTICQRESQQKTKGRRVR